MNVGRRPKPVMRDGQVEDQAPAASGIAQILADIHVAAAVACAGRHLMLGADCVSSFGVSPTPTAHGGGKTLEMKNKNPWAMSGRRGCALRLLVCICATAVVLPRRGFTSSLHAWPTSAPCTSSRGGADSVHQVWSRAGAGRWCAGGSWQRPSGCIRRCGLDATLRLRGGDMGPRAELEPEGACISQKS